jgi:hypothetical protein
MTEKNEQPEFDTPRSSPRATAALDVEVEVAGEMQKVRLVSRDIGAGGMFLRTTNPPPLWKRIKLSFAPPGKEPLEVQGEVVRSITPEASASSGFPPGMAIAFDEVSRAKRKDLVALVLDLCSQRPATKQIVDKQVSSGEPTGAKASEKIQLDSNRKQVAQNKENQKADDMLGELDEMLVYVEEEIKHEHDETEAESEDNLELSVDLEGAEDAEPEEISPGNIVAGDDENELKTALVDYRKALGGDTYYDTLMIGLDAGPDEIKVAYQRLLSRFKPPVPPDSLSPEVLKELSAVLGRIRKAFAILSKPDRKRAYDFLIDNQVEDL